MISIMFPPPHLLVIIVGFVESNNGRRCDLHPDGCGNSLVLERDDHGIGMELRLRMKGMDEMACYTIKTDGTDGCRIAFLAKEYVVGDRGLRLNGAIVQSVDVFYPKIQTGRQDACTTTIAATLLEKLSPLLGQTIVIKF